MNNVIKVSNQGRRQHIANAMSNFKVPNTIYILHYKSNIVDMIHTTLLIPIP